MSSLAFGPEGVLFVGDGAGRALAGRVDVGAEPSRLPFRVGSGSADR
jgi:hypothetical protein